jgi:hypothetical protein
MLSEKELIAMAAITADDTLVLDLVAEGAPTFVALLTFPGVP